MTAATTTSAPSASIMPDSERVELRAEAVGRLFQEHGAYVMRLARRMGVRDGDVEDVTQEVFVVVHRRLHKLRGPDAARAWLFGIVRRLAADYRKRAHHRREVLDDQPARSVEAEVGGGGHAAPGGDPRAELRLLERALDLLDERQRAVFVLYELEGLPMCEVARAMGCPRFTAHTRLRAARRRVRAFLQGELEGAASALGDRSEEPERGELERGERKREEEHHA